MTPKVIDLMGQKFGKLTVIEFCGTGNRNKKAMWKCLCECGNVTISTSDNLRRGRLIGCGKCRSNIRNQYGTYNLKNYNSAFMFFYRTSIGNAKLRNLDYELSQEDVKEITSKKCFYCGCEPYQILKPRNRFDSDFIYNGIDRVDNTKGYILSNVVPCCKKCNQAKMDLPVDKFKKLVVDIYTNWASK